MQVVLVELDLVRAVIGERTPVDVFLGECTRDIAEAAAERARVGEGGIEGCVASVADSCKNKVRNQKDYRIKEEQTDLGSLPNPVSPNSDL